MDEFLEQARQNKDFLTCIETNYPDQFFDWKVTVIFYISIHLLKSLAKQRNVEIGHTHHDIANSLNPRRNSTQIFPFPDWVWKKYSTIFQYSQTSRYNGIKDRNLALIAQKKNYSECVSHLAAFCTYMKTKNIEL